MMGPSLLLVGGERYLLDRRSILWSVVSSELDMC